MQRLVPVLGFILPLVPGHASGSDPSWGIEFGSNYSAMHHRSNARLAEDVDSRLLPTVGVILECPLSAK